MSDEDVALAFLNALARGDTKQAEQLRDQLWDQLGDRVRRWAIRLARGSPHEPDDLAQMAWICFNEILSRWDPTYRRRDGSPSAIWPWLDVVFTRRVIDECRRFFRERELAHEEEAVDSGERERRRSHFRVVFQALRDHGGTADRLRRINCAEQHWLKDVAVAVLAQQHCVPLGKVYAWLKEVERDFGRELLRLYPEYAR